MSDWVSQSMLALRLWKVSEEITVLKITQIRKRFFVSLNDCKSCTNLCSANQQIWFATDSVGKVEKERCKTEEAAKAVCQKWVGGPTPASQIIGAGRRNWRNNETESRTGPALWLQYAIHRCSRQKQVGGVNGGGELRANHALDSACIFTRKH